MSAIAKPSSSVLWFQVWGLALVQGAIALTWVFYNLYLPKLLAQFGFSMGLAGLLLLIENLLSAVMEPLMGTLSDRQQQWVGSRLPFISAGVIGGSALLIAIPAVTVWGSGTLLPWVAVAWALAMTMFRSPALSLLGRYAFGSGLPKAASILTLVGALAGAIAPLASEVILKLGPIVAFGLGSVVLLGAGAALRMLDAQVAPAQEEAEPLRQPVNFGKLGWVFLTGMGVAIGFRLMMQTLPTLLKTQPGANVPLTLGAIFLSIAITAIPAGSLAARLGNARAMLLGLGTMALALALVLQVPTSAGILAIALGAAFSLVSNGTIPFALSQVPPSKAGLGTGIYFSGGALGSSAFFSLFSTISPETGVIVGAAAFLVAGGCVALASRQPL